MPQVEDGSRRGALRRWLRAASATALLFSSGILLPFGGPLLTLLTPQPGLRLAEQARLPALLALVAAVAALVAPIAGIAGTVLYLLGFGLLTLALPILLHREWSLEVTVGCATALVAAALLAAVSLAVSPAELFVVVHRALDGVRDQAVETYGRFGLAPDVVRDIEQASVRLVELLARLTPALFIVSIAGMIVLNLELLRRAQRSRGAAPVFGDLTRWKCPAELVWLLIVAGYGTFLGQGAMQWVAANVFAVLLAVYFCQGLVIAQFYMRRWHSPFWVVGLVYVFIAVEWLLATGVTLLGVFDLWADFRRLNPRPVEED
jgi:uncharacterized protein YybS (DUF2232 family)